MNEFEPAAIADIIKKNTQPVLGEVQRGTVDKVNYAIVPTGMDVRSLKPLLDEYRVKPDRREGTVKLLTVQSFIDMVNRFKAPESVVFGKAVLNDNRLTANLIAVFDYHNVGADNTAAKFARHRARYDFPLSKDFSFWLKNDGTPMSQLDFAMLLEERIIDLVSPVDADKASIEGLAPNFADPSAMLMLSRELEVYSRESLKNRVKLSSGETELKFSTEHVDASGTPVKVPDFFVINLPIFDGGTAQRIIARLRYRIKEGQVLWFYQLYRIDRTLEDAFEAACCQVKADTAVPLFIGEPDAA